MSVPKSSTYKRLAKRCTISTSCSTRRIRAALALHLSARSDELHRLALVEPGRRLVEQQQQRLGHQRAADLDQAAPPEAQRLDRLSATSSRPSSSSGLLFRCSSAFGRPRFRRSFQRPACRGGPIGDEQVLAGVIPVKSSMRWNVRPKPSAPACRWAAG